jgi:hypothetical protein
VTHLPERLSPDGLHVLKVAALLQAASFSDLIPCFTLAVNTPRHPRFHQFALVFEYWAVVQVRQGGDAGDDCFPVETLDC